MIGAAVDYSLTRESALVGPPARISESPAKTARLSDLIPALRHADRSILFTQTVDAAETAAKVVRAAGLSADAIHSQLDPATRRRVLGSFADGHLSVITAPQVLDEGVDVPAADLAVILAASRTRRQMIQRMGRQVLRKKPDGRLARFAILYVEGSSEDPAQGAHGDFLDEVTAVADEYRVFNSNATGAQICSYLENLQRASARTAPAEPAPRRAPLVVSSGRRATSLGSATRVTSIHNQPAMPIRANHGPRSTSPSIPSASKPAKLERDHLAAAQLGITVEELLEVRRAEHQANLVLAAEAKVLGITVKKLRKRRDLR